MADEFTNILDQLEKEREEAKAAQDQRDTLIETLGNTTTQDLQNRMSDISQSAGTQSQIIGEIQSHHDRFQEINHSLGLRLIEPFMGLISPEKTREGQLEQIRVKKSQLDIEKERIAQKEVQFQARQSIREQRIKNAISSASAEQADVTALRQELEDIRAVDQARRGRRTAQLAEIRERREAEAEALSKATPAQLEKAAEGSGKFNPALAKQELARRESRDTALALNTAQLVTSNENIRRLMVQNVLRSLPDEDLAQIKQEAADQGQSTQTVDGKPFIITRGDFDAFERTNVFAQTVSSRVTADMNIVESRDAINDSSRDMAVTAGLAVDPTLSGQDLQAALLAVPGLNSEARAALRRSQAMMQKLEQTKDILPREDAAELLASAEDEMAKAAENMRKNRLSSVSDTELRAATNEYLTGQGIIRDANNASALLNNAMITATTTGSTAYDRIITNIRAKFQPTEAIVQGVLANKSISAAERFASAFQGSSREALVDVLAEEQNIARGRILEQTAKDLGDTDIIKLFDSGQIDSTAQLFSILQARAPERQLPTVEDYVARARDNAARYTRNVYVPMGQHDTVMSAINRMVFNNNADANILAALNRGITEALRRISGAPHVAQPRSPEAAFIGLP